MSDQNPTPSEWLDKILESIDRVKELELLTNTQAEEIERLREDARLARSYPILSDAMVDVVYQRALNQSLREQDRKAVTAVVSDAWHRGAQHGQAARIQADKAEARVAELEKRIVELEHRLREATSLLGELLTMEGAESYGEYRDIIISVLAKQDGVR